MGTRILRILRINIDFFVALRPLRFDFYGLDPPSAACQIMILYDLHDGHDYAGW